MKTTQSGLYVPEKVEEKVEVQQPAEMEILKHLFESTITFFRLVNKTMEHLGYSRQKRRQVWDALVKKSTIANEDIVKALLDELKPILEEAKVMAEADQASKQSSTQTQEVVQ